MAPYAPLHAPSPSEAKISSGLLKTMDLSVVAELLSMPIRVSSAPSKGPRSGELAATEKAVAAPVLFTVVTVIRSSHPVVSLATAGHSGNETAANPWLLKRKIRTIGLPVSDGRAK